MLQRANIAPVDIFIRENTQLFSALDPMKHGKRSRGRPRKNWLPCDVEDAAILRGQQAKDRAHWNKDTSE